MTLRLEDGTVVEPIAKDYGSGLVTVRAIYSGEVNIVKVSDLLCDEGELAKARAIRQVRVPR